MMDKYQVDYNDTALQPTLSSLAQLEQLNLEGCKKVDPVQQLSGLAIPHVSMI